jgi:hypothetical protein
MALTQEDCITAHRAEKKRRISTGPASVQSSRHRFVRNATPRAPQRNAPPGRFVFRPPQQQGGYRPPVPPQQPQQFGSRPNAQQFQQRTALIAVSIAAVRTTLSRIVRGPGSLIKGKVLIRITRTGARGQ